MNRLSTSSLRSKIVRSKIALLASFAASGSLYAQGVATTGSVGVLTVPAAAQSDTIVSLPLHRPDLFRGAITSAVVSGEGVVVGLAQASFAEDAFNQRCYLLLESGGGEGRWFPIADTAGGSVTVDPGGAAVLDSLAPGTVVKIVPFWTLDSVFPNGRGVNASGNLLPVSRVLLPDATRPGIRLAPASSFFYYSGASHGGEGWRKHGSAPAVKFDDQILPPGASIVVRHEGGSGTLFENLGHVQTCAFSTLLGTLEANVPQDHAAGLGLPVSATLAESRLFESGAFAGSGTLEQPSDELLVYDQSLPAKNRTPASVFYYYTGAQGAGPGWRLLGDPATLRDGAAIFQPARGFGIRKAAANPAGFSRWTVRPAYLDAP